MSPGQGVVAPPSRAVLVRGRVSPGEVSVGSGTIVGPRLVLTAAHVVFGDNGAPLPEVTVAPAGQRYDAMVIWPGEYPTTGPLLDDVALIQVTDPQWQHSFGAVAWGWLVGNRPGVPATAVGFPRAKIDSDGRDSDQLDARINPLSNQTAGMYDVDITSPLPTPLEGEASPWSGASGAGVFVGDTLVGVLTTDERQAYPGDRLGAVPVGHLARREEFRVVVTEHGGGLGRATDLIPVELTGVLHPPTTTPGGGAEIGGRAIASRSDHRGLACAPRGLGPRWAPGPQMELSADWMRGPARLDRRCVEPPRELM